MCIIDDQIRQSLKNIQKHTDMDQELMLSFDDCRIKVQTNSSRLKNNLLRYFNQFIIDPDTPDSHFTVKALDSQPPRIKIQLKDKAPEKGKKKIKEQYADLGSGRIIRKKLTNLCFYFDNQENLVVGPCTANENQVINFINNRFIQWKLDQGCLLCHAAAVTSENQALIIAGFSGMGKSTLALHLMNKGTTFISNDRLMIENKPSGLKIYGVAKLPRVNPGTILNNPSLLKILNKEEEKRFRKIGAQKIWSVEHKYDVCIDECFGQARFKLASYAKALVILNWHRIPKTPELRKVDLTQRLDLLDAVIKSPGLFYLPSAGKPGLVQNKHDYLNLFECCDVYELSGGIGFLEAAEKCHKLISA
ncbi:HprK-related kinase B [Desulfonatronovibrio hydrogenovorans]|uniref:HprK-related kinase B n=1 Tax=Desulfonatronovibrio hydrogenovorans TaxID=53245 RepID=UPI000491E29A|nr:HprK-related kinase B [Desulfonatronovibrio hydrogenovorans]